MALFGFGRQGQRQTTTTNQQREAQERQTGQQQEQRTSQQQRDAQTQTRTQQEQQRQQTQDTAQRGTQQTQQRTQQFDDATLNALTQFLGGNIDAGEASRAATTGALANAQQAFSDFNLADFVSGITESTANRLNRETEASNNALASAIGGSADNNSIAALVANQAAADNAAALAGVQSQAQREGAGIQNQLLQGVLQAAAPGAQGVTDIASLLRGAVTTQTGATQQETQAGTVTQDRSQQTGTTDQQTREQQSGQELINAFFNNLSSLTEQLQGTETSRGRSSGFSFSI